MHTKTALAALAVASTSMFAATSGVAATFDVVTGGEAHFTLDSDVLDEFSLGSNWDNDGDGVHESTVSVRAWDTAFGVPSELIPGGALLQLSGRGVYLYPTNSADEEIETFETVYAFPFRSSDETDAAGVTDEMRQINYVPTGNPNEYTDFETGDVVTLTPEQVALLNEGNLRTCCRHTLNGLSINTADMTVDGVIDNNDDRGIDFYLFDLIPTTEVDVYDLAVTEIFAQFLSLGFSQFGFVDPTDFLAEWDYSGVNDLVNDPIFSAGDVVGTLSFSYSTAAVPVPAALPLLAGGLGIFGAMRARRKRTAA